MIDLSRCWGYPYAFPSLPSDCQQVRANSYVESTWRGFHWTRILGQSQRIKSLWCMLWPGGKGIPRTTAPYQMLAFSPTSTFPTSVALGATNAPLPMLGLLILRFCRLLCRQTAVEFSKVSLYDHLFGVTPEPFVPRFMTSEFSSNTLLCKTSQSSRPHTRLGKDHLDLMQTSYQMIIGIIELFLVIQGPSQEYFEQCFTSRSTRCHKYCSEKWKKRHTLFQKSTVPFQAAA